jgi:hypothetical protein
MIEVSLTAGVMTKRGVQLVVAVWEVERVNWWLLDPKDQPVSPDTIPCSLYDFSFSNKNGSFRYVPLSLERWTFWDRLKFLFMRRHP